MNFLLFTRLSTCFQLRWSSICLFRWRRWRTIWMSRRALLPLMLLLSIRCMCFFVILDGYRSGASRLAWTLARWPCPPVSTIHDHRRLPRSTDSPESSQTSRRPLTFILVIIWKAVLCRNYSFGIWICGFVILNYVPRSGAQLIKKPDPVLKLLWSLQNHVVKKLVPYLYHLKLKNVKLFSEILLNWIVRIFMRIQEANWLPYGRFLSTGSRSHDIAESFKILVLKISISGISLQIK